MGKQSNTNIEPDNMSPFFIFFIIVTICYIIYYAAIITIDLNTKPKTSTESSETVDTDGIVNESSDYSEEEQSDAEDEQPGITINEEGSDESDNEGFNDNDADEARYYHQEENFLAEQDAVENENLPNEEAIDFDDDPYNLGDGETEEIPTDETPTDETPDTNSLEEDTDIKGEEVEEAENVEPEPPSEENNTAASQLTGAEHLQENARRMMEGMDGIEFDDEAYKDNDLKEEDIFEQEEPQYSVTVINPENYEESELVKRANDINEPIQAESTTPVDSKQLTPSVFEMLGVIKEEHFSNV